MSRRHLNRSVALSAAAALLVIYGCQTPTDTRVANTDVKLGKVGSPTTTGGQVIFTPPGGSNTGAATQAPAPVNSLRGRLVGANGQALPNTRVAWGELVAITNDKGEFYFPAAPASGGFLTAFPDGHQPLVMPVDSPNMTVSAKPYTEQPMAITAAAGGLYTATDGSIKAQVPPGALNGDATIRIARIDTSNIPVTEWYVPGIQFAVDLGGATLNPDTQIMVTAKVDERFVDELKKRDSAFSPEKYNLAQDAAGAWVMAMPIKGPSSTSATITEGPVTVNPFPLQEFGGMPLPANPNAAASVGASYKVAFVPGTYDYDDEMVRLTNGQVIRAPKTTAEWSSMEHAGVFGCGVFPHCYYYGKLVTRNNTATARAAAVTAAKAAAAALAAYEASHPVSTPKPTPTPDPAATGAASPAPTPTPDAQLAALKADLKAKEDAIRAIDKQADDAGSSCDLVVSRVNIPTHTTWISDDPALNGKNAAGAVVHFSMMVGGFTGPNDITTDGSGNATTNALQGADIAVTPTLALGPVSGDTVNTRAAANMNPVELKVAKYSPKVLVNFSATGADLPATVTVSYAIDGGAAVTKSDMPITYNGTNKRQGAISFYAPVADDSYHSIKLTAVNANSLDSREMPAAQNGRRNGKVTFAVELFSNAAK